MTTVDRIDPNDALDGHIRSLLEATSPLPTHEIRLCILLVRGFLESEYVDIEPSHSTRVLALTTLTRHAELVFESGRLSRDSDGGKTMIDWIESARLSLRRDIQ